MFAENSRSLIGISKLINKDNSRTDLNIEDIENSMIKNEEFISQIPKTDTKPKPSENKYDMKLQELMEKLNLSKPEERSKDVPNIFANPPSVNNFSGTYENNISKHSDGGQNSEQSEYNIFGPGVMKGDEKPDHGSALDDADAHSFNSDLAAPELISDRFSSPSKETQEKNRHQQIRSTMEEMGMPSMNYSFEREKREDSKSVMLEEIDFLKDELVESNYTIDRIPSVGQSSAYEEIESVLRMLRHKCDRIKYCDFAEQFLMVGIYGLEEIFDGKRSFWGYTPDLTGWSSSVQLKLRRMRYDTSQIVSQVMYDYNIGPGMRLLLELVPSAIIHSKTRRDEAEKNTAREARGKSDDTTDKRVLDAVERLRDI